MICFEVHGSSAALAGCSSEAHQPPGNVLCFHIPRHDEASSIVAINAHCGHHNNPSLPWPALSETHCLITLEILGFRVHAGQWLVREVCSIRVLKAPHIVNPIFDSVLTASWHHCKRHARLRTSSNCSPRYHRGEFRCAMRSWDPRKQPVYASPASPTAATTTTELWYLLGNTWLTAGS